MSGNATIRLDEGTRPTSPPARVSGRVQVDGVVRSGSAGPTNYQGSVGELSGSFVDVRANAVSGDLTVLRRGGASASASGQEPSARRPAASRRQPSFADGFGRTSGGVAVMTPVFSHGDLRLYLLSLLDEGPRHGYDIMQALSDRTGGTYTASAGTIYPRLAKLEEEGLVTKTVDGRKTVYEITEAGRAEVASRAGDLEGIEAGLADSVRLIADEVRGSVREAMKSLRADLAAASKEERAERDGPERPRAGRPAGRQPRAAAPGGCRDQRVPRRRAQRPALARGARRIARGIPRRRRSTTALESAARSRSAAACKG